jgi:hypothetical protein
LEVQARQDWGGTEQKAVTHFSVKRGMRIVYGGRYRCVWIPPTHQLFLGCLMPLIWFNVLVVGWNTTEFELHAAAAIV